MCGRFSLTLGASCAVQDRTAQMHKSCGTVALVSIGAVDGDNWLLVRDTDQMGERHTIWAYEVAWEPKQPSLA